MSDQPSSGRSTPDLQKPVLLKPEPPRSRMRDFWTLHIPLVLVLGICTFATVREASRGLDGNWRAVVYTFEWPLIGAFAVVVWNRYRRHGSLSLRFKERWEQRIRGFQDEDAKAEAEAAARARAEAEASTPEARAWQAHVAQLNRDEGTPDLR